MNGGEEYKAQRLGGLERVRGGEKVIIRARERKEKKSICSSRLSRSCFTLSHEPMSRVWPVRSSFLTESIVVSVSIREIAFSQSLKRQSTDSNKSIVGEPTTTTTLRAMKPLKSGYIGFFTFSNNCLLQIFFSSDNLFFSFFIFIGPMEFCRYARSFRRTGRKTLQFIAFFKWSQTLLIRILRGS